MNNDSGQRQTLKQSIIMGTYFMLTFTTWSSFSYILTYILGKDDHQYSYAATVGLMTCFGFYMIFLTFTPSIKLYKLSFQISALLHSVNYAFYIFEFQFQLGLIVGVVACIFGGIGAALYQVSQGGYMVKLFRIYKIPEDHQGKYYGIMSGIVYSSYLFGAFVTTFGLGLFGTQIYFIILTALSMLSWLICTLFLDSLQGKDLPEINQQQQQPQIAQNSKKSFKESMKQQKQTIISLFNYIPVVYPLIVPFLMDGIIVGFISTYFSQLVPSMIKSDLNVGYLLIAQGLGATFGPLVCGSMCDKYKIFNIGKICLVFIAVTCMLTLINSEVELKDMYFVLLVGLVYGFVLGFYESWINITCVKVFDGSLNSFALMRQFQSLAVLIVQLYFIINNNKINVILYSIVLITLSVLSWIIFDVFQKRRKNQKDSLLASQQTIVQKQQKET